MPRGNRLSLLGFSNLSHKLIVLNDSKGAGCLNCQCMTTYMTTYMTKPRARNFRPWGGSRYGNEKVVFGRFSRR